MARYRRRKYFNVRIPLGDDGLVIAFDSCREAAHWFYDSGISKSVPAALVGMSTVLTGKRERYRSFTVTAERRY